MSLKFQHPIRATINRRAIQREAIAMMIGATAIITGTMGLSLTINARAKAQPNWSLILVADGNAYTMGNYMVDSRIYIG